MTFTRQGLSVRAAMAVVLLALIPRSAPAQDAMAAGNQQYRAAADLQRGNQFELAVAAWNEPVAVRESRLT